MAHTLKYQMHYIEPINEHEVEESYANPKRSSVSVVSSDFSEFEKPPKIIYEENQTYLKPSIKQSYTLQDPKQKKMKKKKNCKSSIHLKNYMQKLHHNSQHKKPSQKTMKENNASKNRYDKMNKAKQTNKKYTDKNNKNIKSTANLYLRNRLTISSSQIPLNNSLIKSSSDAYINHVQSRKPKSKSVYTSEEQLITEHKKSDFKTTIPECVFSMPKQNTKKLKIIENGDGCLKVAESNGGVAYQINTKDFVFVDKARSCSNRTKTKSKPKEKSKEEILRMRKIAFSYGQYIRRLNFGYL